MAAFLDACRFTPTLGGTTDWTYLSAVTGYQSPGAAGAVNGTVYRYRAESADLSQWEIGYGAYNSGTGTFARTAVLYNSLGTTTLVSFSAVPQVAIVALKEDLISVGEANSFTIPQQTQVQSNINLPTIYRRSLLPWLAKWGTARLPVLQGTANAKLLCIGDSTTAGARGSTPTYPTAWPTVLAALLTTAGLNASAQSRFGDGANGVNLTAADPRVVMGGSYVVGTIPTLGGSLFFNNGTISTPWSFTPTVNTTHFDVYTITLNGLGSLKIDINGGGATTINETAVSAGVVKTTISAALGANTLNITPVSGNTYFIGAIGYNSAAKEVSVINCGVNGALVSSFALATDVWNPIGAIGSLAPDLTIIDLTVNDAIGGTALTSYVTFLKAITTAALVSGNVIYIGGAPIQASSATLATQLAINNAMAATAASLGINFISMFDLWGSRAAVIAAGYDAGDGVHMSIAGYAAMAAQIAPHLV